MGVDVPDRSQYEQNITPRQKLRAGVLAVMATIRMRKTAEQWRGVKIAMGAMGSSKSRQQSVKKGERDSGVGVGVLKDGRRVREV